MAIADPPGVAADSPPAPLAAMAYRPALDGLRAVSVIAVICYHAGFGWASGGFFGVEVFFVISGYLITVLLIDEHERSGRISIRAFWARRARRLLPALAAVLLATSLWVAAFGSAQQAAQMRHDLPWAIAYLANWGQIESGVPYFAGGSPPMLRHLWSLAVEEQWYVVWPLAFAWLVRRRRWALGLVLGGVAAASALAWAARAGAWPFAAPGRTSDELVNIAYLSTPTRAGGLLLGAALALCWRPWRREHAAGSGDGDGRVLRIAAAFAVAGLLWCFAVAHLTAAVVYPWVLLLVGGLSVVVIASVVHPVPGRTQRWLASPLAAGIGRRSYGLYLWHWPVFVVLGATEGSWSRAIVAITVAAVLAEISLHVVEAPFRRAPSPDRPARPLRIGLVPALTTVLVAGGLAVHYSRIAPYDAAAGGESVTFELRSLAVAPDVAAPTTAASPDPAAVTAPSTTVAATSAAPTTAMSVATVATTTTPTTVPRPPIPLPVRLGIVGDSQAHSLAINLPDGIEAYFDIDDGSLDGCGVVDRGVVRSARRGFSSELERCAGWQDRWASTAADNDMVLVVIGAWEVFDIERDDRLVRFGTRAHDAMLASGLRDGLDRITAEGAIAVVLEVPCMRPVDSRGAGVPALPERGNDRRVAHLNELIGEVVADHPDAVLVPGPGWCDDEEVATDLDYRWDGVHVYRQGAAYVYEAVAPALLELAGA